MIGFQAPSLNCLEATEICCLESEPIEAYASVVSWLFTWNGRNERHDFFIRGKESRETRIPGCAWNEVLCNAPDRGCVHHETFTTINQK